MSGYPQYPQYPPSYPQPGGQGYGGQHYPSQGLAYTTPMSGGRPGVVSAIGVISIVVACLSMLASAGGAMWGVGMLKLVKMTAAAGRTTARSAVVAAAATPAPATKPAKVTAPTAWA